MASPLTDSLTSPRLVTSPVAGPPFGWPRAGPEKAASALAAKPEEVVFVSSNRWDVMGAAAFGLRPLWVNRAKMPEEYAEYQPVREIADLTGLASLAA